MNQEEPQPSEQEVQSSEDRPIRIEGQVPVGGTKGRMTREEAERQMVRVRELSDKALDKYLVQKRKQQPLPDGVAAREKPLIRDAAYGLKIPTTEEKEKEQKEIARIKEIARKIQKAKASEKDQS